MALYAISDLHLALDEDKPMDVFGDKWYMHQENIKKNWLETIKNDDTVLIAGDISWSLKIEGGIKDLDWIHQLPGEKILIKGNHDYWWSSINKLNSMYDNMHFIQNNFFTYKDYAICGTRGWLCPFSEGFEKKDEKIYKREIIRLRLSLQSAKEKGHGKFIVMLHYPPISEKQHVSDFVSVIEEFQVEKVIFGHLHGIHSNKEYNYIHNGTQYFLTSCDFLNFKPILIEK